MKKGDLIKVIELKKGINTITLDRIYPLEPLKSKNLNIITYMIDDEVMKDGVIYANKLMIDAKNAENVELKIGAGYIAEKDDELTNQFISYHGWSGGDGIYSFNITNGKDGFDLREDLKTLFFFGDTFVGTSDLKTHQRYQPHLMPNNSFGVHEHGKTNFLIKMLSKLRKHIMRLKRQQKKCCNIYPALVEVLINKIWKNSIAAQTVLF